MTPYVILILGPVIPFLLGSKMRKKHNLTHISLIIFFTLLFLMLSLKSTIIGRDTINYEYLFERFSAIDWKEILLVDIEPAYVAWNKFIALFTDNFQWFLVFTSIITVLPLLILYVREAESPIMTIAIFITMSTFVMLFSGLRQSIAFAIGVIAYEFVKRKKFLKFVLMVIVACLFHKSAFILLLMYPVYHAKITKKWIFFVALLMSLIFVFNRQIFSFIGSFVSNAYNISMSSTGAYTMLILFILFAIFSFVVPDEKRLDNNVIGLRNLLLLSVVIQMFAPVHVWAMRMNYYYLIFIPLLIPKIANRSSERYRQIAFLSKFVITVSFYMYFLIKAPMDNVLDTFPYQFFWENSI